MALELNILAGEAPRSGVIRKAIRHYLATARIAGRRREVEAYMCQSGEQRIMRKMAEMDIADAEMP